MKRTSKSKTIPPDREKAIRDYYKGKLTKLKKQNKLQEAEIIKLRSALKSEKDKGVYSKPKVKVMTKAEELSIEEQKEATRLKFKKMYSCLKDENDDK